MPIAIGELVGRFPDDDVLGCMYAVALAQEGQARQAARQLDELRARGTDPAKILSPEMVQKIEELAAPPLWERAAYGALLFTGVYALIMIAMVVIAWILAVFTRGGQVLMPVGADPSDIVHTGQVARSGSETLLARVYLLVLTLGLILFYVAIPFVVLGLLGGTAGLLYLILLTGRIPIKLFLVILIVGLMMAWAVFRSLFAKAGTGGFGIRKTETDEPQLHGLLAEVAQRVDTDPVNEVYLGPGSEIGVHQTGRGPFGIFGVKQRVLTLGLASLQYLTADELRSILAHEYAHFSHGDTFTGRFIHQVTLSIEQSLRGMGEAGGAMNYVNPFFWFMYLYYKAYSMMAAGFSRSREFLADRMAAVLYGSDVFKKALTKVATHGSYFEMGMYNNVAHLLESNQMFENVYDAHREHEKENPENPDRDKMFLEILSDKGSLFASHPTIAERFAAVEAYPQAETEDETSALRLLSDPPAREKELTEFVTGYVHHLHQMQAAAGE